MTLRILLNFAPDQTAVHRSRLRYAFSLFCAIYDHQPIFEVGQSERADIRISYSADGTGATSLKTLNLSNLYRPRPLHKPAPPPKSYAIDGERTVLFYAAEPGREPDWLGEIFEWVSCADEYSIQTKDPEGRIPFAKTYVGRHRLDTHRPYAAIAMSLLQKTLCRILPGTPLDPVSPAPSVRHFVINTHDVDSLPISRASSVGRLAGNAIISLLVYNSPKLAVDQATKALKMMLGGEDPLDQIPSLVQEETRRGVSATYLFLTQKRHRRDGNYSFDESSISDLLRSLDRKGMEVALHGSYCSLENEHTLGAEFNHLRQRGFAVKGNRQHWLRFTLDRLIPALEQAGAAYDSSLGWYESIGFRGGACFAYPPYNVDNERPSSFLEIPLAVMDVSLLSGQVPEKSWYDRVTELLAASRRYGWGGIALLWHPTTFGGGQYPTALGELFWRLVDGRRNMKDTWTSASDFVESVRQRYVQVGLLPLVSAREPEASCATPLSPC
jgi:hypothetical protein